MSIYPALRYRDAKAAIAWLKDALGFEEVSVHEADGRVGHAELTIGGANLSLSDPYPDFGCAAPSGDLAAVSIILYVPDVDAAVARAEARGARVVRAIEETFYGTRRATLLDPFGHRWMIGTHVRDVSEPEMKAAADRFAESGSEG